MEELLPITNINDFLFCPRSLYYGNIFRRSRGKDVFKRTPQKIGLAEHQTLDEGTYSSCKDVLTGLTVYCESLGLVGRIDLFDVGKKMLVERKWSVSAVWEGFKMQLYAQCRAVREMGYDVAELKLHSKKDNRTYDIPLPTEGDWRRLANIIELMKKFRMEDPFAVNPKKCAHCIYSDLCDTCPTNDEGVRP